jgi:tyrosine-protein phosphatase non-receptor type 4
MVWEQKSCLIVSATPLVENGKIKCAKYWPDVDEKMDYGNGLSVTCVKETESPSMIERELILTHETALSSAGKSKKGQEQALKETRIITHIQYIAWPDHGVPEDYHDFLSLVNKVRNIRMGSVDPVVVHCRSVILHLKMNN